jgi:hypothetical protein
LDAEYKEVIADNLDWHDLVWSDFQLQVNSQVFEPLHNFKLYDITSPVEEEAQLKESQGQQSADVENDS